MYLRPQPSEGIICRYEAWNLFHQKAEKEDTVVDARHLVDVRSEFEKVLLDGFYFLCEINDESSER